MSRPGYWSVVLTACVAATATAACGAQQTPAGHADLVIRGGPVITVDAHDRIASAVAVIGDRIVAVGGGEEIQPFIGPSTLIIDLAGRALLPGFIDTHSHVEGLAESEFLRIPVQVPPLKDTAAIIERLKERQATMPPGAWLIGQGTYMQPMPSRAELDAAFPDNPVDLRWSAHDHLINHKAAVVLGLTKDRPDPGGRGRFERLPNGEVYIYRDADVGLPEAEFTYATMKSSVRDTLDLFYLRKGVTTVHDMSSSRVIRAYQELRRERALPTRVLVSFSPNKGSDDRFIIPSGLHTGFGDDWIALAGIKIMLDGVWGTTAYTYKPHERYSAGEGWLPDNYGGTALSQDELDAKVLAAHAAGFQIYVHALGDRAQDMVLDAFEKAQRAHPGVDARLRIEHFGHAYVDDPARTTARLARMKRLGAIPACHVAMLWRVNETVLQEKGVKFFPLKTIIDAGFHPPGGVDTLGTQNFASDPLFSISRAVNRTARTGLTVHADEAIPVMDAIRMFTSWAAEGSFVERSRGTIEIGKLADFVVLSADPLKASGTQLEQLRAEMTIVGGVVAFRQP